LNRRDFLRAGTLAVGGLTLPSLLAGREAAGTAARETSVILLYLHGGPSHLETYDLKPNAPTEYRSVFKPIATNVPGMDVCELFPLQARLADKFSLVRSLHHSMTSHSDGGIEILTGKTPIRPDPSSNSRSEHPDVGCVASKMRGDHPLGQPRYVSIPRQPYMTRPAYLGLQHAAFEVSSPSTPSTALRLNPHLALSRLGDLRDLGRRFDRLNQNLGRAGGDGANRFHDLAVRMLTSPHVARAFDLTLESDKVRQRYGNHLWGQACLLARRLAEAGTALTTLYVDTPQSGPDFTNWDDHALNAGRPGHFGHYVKVRLPYLDQALSALIEDVFSRGLHRHVLIVVMGEFGRTPRLSTSRNPDGVGRDHWPDAYTALVSGGGLRMGQVVGATNSKGEFPSARPYSPRDLLATIYRHLGIDYHHAFLDHTGRPVHVLAEGRPIPELI
jgi:uncharacterized protein (DUF1501 family)